MKELACQLGIAHGTLKYWELHKSEPSVLNRKLLVAYLGFDPGGMLEQDSSLDAR